MDTLRLSKPPNYDALPLVIFNAVGHQIVLPLPEYSGSTPPDIAPTDLDIENYPWIDPKYPNQEGCLSLIYNLGWNIHRSDNGSYMGMLFLGVSIMENRSNKFNFMDEDSFKDWMLTRNSEVYAPLNEDIKKDRELCGLECDSRHLLNYAKTSNDIFSVVSHDRKWFGEKRGFIQGGSEISINFRTPLNSKYSLNLEFDWGATSETYEAFKAEVDDLQLEYLQKVRLIPNT